MLDAVPWFIGGEAQHSPEVARMVAHAATQGANGIIGARDLEVRALNVPGTQVEIYPGQAVLRNAYPAGAGQSYMVRNKTLTALDIPATGSAAGATRYVIIRTLDPQYNDQAPADLVKGPYITADLVTSITNLNYPHVVLAKIVQPPSTGTIEQSMITDLRQLANPREKTNLRIHPHIATDTGLNLTATSENGEFFPNDGGVQRFDIPEWATRAQVRAQWLSVRYPAGDHYGDCWVEYGPWSDATGLHERETQRYSWDTPNVSSPTKSDWMVADDVYIPAAYRGTNQPFVMKARRFGDLGAAMTDKSGVVMEIRFLETADPSTT